LELHQKFIQTSSHLDEEEAPTTVHRTYTTMISCCAGFKKEAAEETESPCEQKIEETMENDDTFTNGAPILSMIKCKFRV
jgi:hypothetical protein